MAVTQEKAEKLDPQAAHDLKAGCCAFILQEIEGLHAKLDELLEDSRRARPMLDRYLKLTSPTWLRKARS